MVVLFISSSVIIEQFTTFSTKNLLTNIVINTFEFVFLPYPFLFYWFQFTAILPPSESYTFGSILRESVSTSFTIAKDNETFVDHSLLISDYGFSTADMSDALKQVWQDVLTTSTQLADMEPDVKVSAVGSGYVWWARGRGFDSFLRL